MNQIPQIQPAEPDLIGDTNMFASIDEALTPHPKQESTEQDTNGDNIVDDIANKGETEKDQYDNDKVRERDSFDQVKGEDTRPQTPLFNDIKARNEDDLSGNTPNSKIIA